MPNSKSQVTKTHKAIGALVTESTRVLRSQEAAVERAQERLNDSTKSFNAQMHEAGAQSRDFKKATASSDAVYNFYRTAVVAALPKGEQTIIAGNGGETKRKLLQLVSARMGSIGKALARMEGLANGTVTDKRTKAAKAETAKGKAQSTAQDMTPESGTATEADSVLPPQIRDPRMVGLLNMIAQLTIEDQAKCYEIMVKAYDVFLTKSINAK